MGTLILCVREHSHNPTIVQKVITMHWLHSEVFVATDNQYASMGGTA